MSRFTIETVHGCVMDSKGTCGKVGMPYTGSLQAMTELAAKFSPEDEATVIEFEIAEDFE